MSQTMDDRRKLNGPGWWKLLANEEECPITLEPLASLPYPPFELYASIRGDTISYYFDGYALASYIVSRAIFQNPLTRHALTMEDCRRLDDYLERYCKFHGDNGRTRMARVAEAFALREMVHVSSSNHHAGQQGQDEISRRAEVLRSEAASALAGLFVFSSQRNTRFAARRNRSEASSADGPPAVGFDLHLATPDMGSAVLQMEGLTIIDDDELLAVESETEKYQQVQESFPPLSSASAVTSIPVPTPDLDLLESVKTTAALTKQQEEDRRRRLQAANQRLALEAEKGKQRRAQERAQRKRMYIQEQERRQREKEERRQALEELEKWRDEQWEQLRLRTEVQQEQERQKVKEEARKQARLRQEQAEALELLAKEAREKEETEALKAKTARQKAKAAEKRKRAKERKQAKKAAELKEAQEKEHIAAIEREKEASSSKCAACGDGILDCGFEKWGSKFCSPKCARAGPSLK